MQPENIYSDFILHVSIIYRYWYICDVPVSAMNISPTSVYRSDSTEDLQLTLMDCAWWIHVRVERRRGLINEETCQKMSPSNP